VGRCVGTVNVVSVLGCASRLGASRIATVERLRGRFKFITASGVSSVVVIPHFVRLRICSSNSLLFA
jgi:hypothetical protein